MQHEVQCVERVVITRIPSEALGHATMVIHIPPTCAEHNILIEVLDAIRKGWPGAWLCALQRERDEREGTSYAKPTRIGEADPTVPPAVPLLTYEAIAKVKATSAAELEMKPQQKIVEDLGDVPL